MSNRLRGDIYGGFYLGNDQQQPSKAGLPVYLDFLWLLFFFFLLFYFLIFLFSPPLSRCFIRFFSHLFPVYSLQRSGFLPDICELVSFPPAGSWSTGSSFPFKKRQEVLQDGSNSWGSSRRRPTSFLVHTPRSNRISMMHGLAVMNMF